jgi:hypothetical protein
MEWLFVAKLDSLIFSLLLLAIPTGQKFNDYCPLFVKRLLIGQILYPGYLS